MPRRSKSERILAMIFTLLFFLYNRMHILWVGRGENEATARFALRLIHILAFTKLLWVNIRFRPRVTLQFVGGILYTILIRDKVGFWKGQIGFNHLDFMVIGLLGFGHGVVIAGMSLLPIDSDAPNFLGFKTISAILYSSMNPLLAVSMPLIGLLIAAICSIRLPPRDWFALIGGRRPSPPAPPPPPRGGEPLPTEGAGGEPLPRQGGAVADEEEKLVRAA